MFLLFLVLWLILNGKVTAEILILGLLVSLCISLLFYKMIGHSVSTDLFIIRNLPLLILYFLNLIKEIIKAASTVIAVVWKSPGRWSPIRRS